MDRISDSGSDDRRSIRLGGTKTASSLLAVLVSVRLTRQTNATIPLHPQGTEGRLFELVFGDVLQAGYSVIRFHEISL